MNIGENSEEGSEQGRSGEGYARAAWQTRLGFYFAAVGSAFGLGNLWRFPYVVSENGGGAFVLIYIFLAFFIGIPLIISELVLGKMTRLSVLGAVKTIVKNKRSLSVWTARLAIFSSLVVLSYYAVISGWVLHYLVRFFVAACSSQALAIDETFNTLQGNGWLQVALASVHLIACIVIVMRGVRDGLERWVGYMMPAFAILLMLLIARSLSLPTSVEAIRFLFYPDFSKLTISSLGQALGHVCFTLGLGFGMMVTFGSYLRRDVIVSLAGLRVAFVDTFVSLLAGLLIFPIILSLSGDHSGPNLLFEGLPLLFSQLEWGTFYALVFFLCLYLAALGASIGLLEAIVSNWVDRNGIGRWSAAWMTGAQALLLAIIPALSSSALAGFQWRGLSVLELFDSVLIHWLLPIVALCITVLVARCISKEELRKHFGPQQIQFQQMFENWWFLIRWIAPVIIVIALGLQTVGLFV